MRALRFLNLMAGLAILAAAMAMLGANVAPSLDVLTHLAYPLLLCAIACFGLSLLMSRPRGGAQRVVAGLALIACLILTGPELAARLRPHTGPAGEPQLRVMSYNLFWLNNAPDATEASVRSSGADVVMFIESGGRMREFANRFTDLYPYKSFCPCGLTILSRWPIVDDYIQRYGWPPPQSDTTISWAVIDSPAGVVPVMGVHMHWPTRAAQAIDRANLVKEAALFDRRSLIVMGDFNSTPWSVFVRTQDKLLGLERRTRGLPTWPARVPGTEHLRAPFPVMPIDHVYAGSDWRTLSVRRGPSGGSDHYPVIVTLARRSDR